MEFKGKKKGAIAVWCLVLQLVREAGATPETCPESPAGLLYQWTLHEQIIGTSDETAESCSSSETATLLGEPTFTGGGIHFDGENDAVEVPSFTLGGALSFSACGTTPISPVR